ncbi:MAG: response regulator [Solirubrobacterales bacterium]|nr:response regulator [Solirubrobacterales bacterium]
MTSAARVVLADDHDSYRQGLARAIARCRDLELVGEASDGQAALELVRTTAPDLVVLDVRMPGMTGLELARELQGLKGTTVVLLTGTATTALGEAARAAGARAVLSKELSRHDICRRLLKIQQVL